jgi:hypothetical protein
VIVIQTALLIAVHVHPADVATLTLPVPGLAPKDWLDGLIAYEHPPPAPCDTV